MITNQVCQAAVNLSLPTLREMGETDFCRWPMAPKGFAIYINALALGLPNPFKHVMAEQRTSPNPNWPNFIDIAAKKAVLTLRTGLPTSMILKLYPWLLMEDDSLYGGAVITTAGNQKIVVATSGLKSETDEAAAKIVLTNIELISHLAVRDLLELVREDKLKAVPGNFNGMPIET